MSHVPGWCRSQVRPALLLAAVVGELGGCSSEGSSEQTASLGGAGLGGSASAAAGASGASGASNADAPAGGSGGATASGSNEGLPNLGGISASAGSTGNSGSPGEPAAPDAGSVAMEPEVSDERPFFSFFVTSQGGLFGLPAGKSAPLPSATNGYGGNLGGLAGADEICTMLARASNPGDRKTWRAFLSTSAFDGSTAVNAIDRVGSGPWYDYNGLLLAATVQDLLPASNNGRPNGDPQLINMFSDENGEDVRPNQQIDNHDTLTGSGPDGRLFNDGNNGRTATCENWTSSTLRSQPGMMGGGMMGGMGGGQVPVGHAWPRSNTNGRNWISDHTVNGCEAGADIDGGMGAPAGDFRVGAGGGYGGFYCFALGAVPPG